MAKLENPKHEHYCKSFVKCLNQTAAYTEAYGEKKGNRSRASALMANVDIVRRIKELQERVSARMDIDADNIIKCAAEIRRRCMGQVVKVENPECPDGSLVETYVDFDAPNALKANDQLARLTGSYDDGLNVNVKPLTIEQIVQNKKDKEDAKLKH